MSDRVHLRPWQRAAFELFRSSTDPDFLAVATPGAGKTTFALTCARAALADAAARDVHQRVVVVAPTSHLKLQWAQAAHRLGLELDHGWSPADGLARDVHGLVTTYQHVATGDTAKRLRRLADGAFVILDEVHHAGDERAWGTSIRAALEPAARRLSLSGTPFRSDANPIPFVRYAETGEGTEAQPDFTYGYADALRDGGVVRPVYFPRFDGLMEWTSPDGLVQRADFHDELDRTAAAQRLRAALSLDGEWLPSVVTQAHERLTAIRERQQPDAGGLVIAADQEHARGIANLIRRRFGQHAEVVVSDDPDASRKIAAFASASTPWLVAVRMVSEGVDIPRLRVGVYATTVATELFFRQAVGRFVRWQAGRHSQKAYVFIPDDPRLRIHAFGIADARRHVLRPPSEADDDPVADLERDLAEVAATEEPPEQLSLFSVLSAVATGVSVHAFTEDGLTLFDDEPDPPEPSEDNDRTALARWGLVPGEPGGATTREPAGQVDRRSTVQLDVELADIPTELGYVAGGRVSIAERKELLRDRNAALTRALVDRTGWTFGRVNAELNKAVGITTVGSATNEQLERRAKRADGWLRNGRI
ncbi:MAG: DEAD/DEAH box helicase family protein [Ilumatobacteraceae bacterium]